MPIPYKQRIPYFQDRYKRLKGVKVHTPDLTPKKSVNISHPKKKVHTKNFTPKNITSEQFQFLLTELKKIQEQNMLFHYEISEYLKEKDQIISELKEKLNQSELEKNQLIENCGKKRNTTKKVERKKLDYPNNLKPKSPEWWKWYNSQPNRKEYRINYDKNYQRETKLKAVQKLEEKENISAF